VDDFENAVGARPVDSDLERKGLRIGFGGIVRVMNERVNGNVGGVEISCGVARASR